MALDELINLELINVMEEVEMDNFNNRLVLHRLNAFDLPDKKFVKLFRLSKGVTKNLIEKLEPFLIAQTRASALDITTKVLTALKFYASGSYQIDAGYNIFTAVSQSSVSRCVREVSTALNQPYIFNRFVSFPKTIEALNNVRNEFFKNFNFPGVVGCIDCTHIAIIAPRINEHQYVNRKQYHSINVQLVCDQNLKIMNCCARFPGSCNDSYIWNNSNLKEYFLNLHAGGNTNFFLLGDSGYALRTYMQTPILNPEPLPNSPEYRYNQAQTSTRSVIERCNGVLKTRFRCLLKHRVLHYDPEMASKIINACVVLHNICIENNVPQVELEPGDEEIDFGLFAPDPVDNAIIGRVNPDLALGRSMQRNIIRNYFT